MRKKRCQTEDDNIQLSWLPGRRVGDAI